FVNGVSQGTRHRNSQDFPAAGLRWMVVFKEGNNTLEVVARKDGVTVRDRMTQQYQTATWGMPAAIRLEVVETEDDTVTLQATLHDAEGVRCLDAADYIHFSAIGDGYLLADQGTSDGSRKVQAYNGRAIIRLKRTGGQVAVGASVNGLETVVLHLPVESLSADSIKAIVTETLRDKTMRDAHWARS